MSTEAVVWMMLAMFAAGIVTGALMTLTYHTRAILAYKLSDAASNADQKEKS